MQSILSFWNKVFYIILYDKLLILLKKMETVSGL